MLTRMLQLSKVGLGINPSLIRNSRKFSGLIDLKGKGSKTASMIIVGSDLLNGKKRDMNVMFLGDILSKNDIQLKSVQIIPDDIETISQTIKHNSEHHDYVFTCGGITPNRDSFTYEAAAKAFGLKLEHHQPTLDRMERIKKFLTRSTSPEMLETRRNLALLPTPSKIFHPCDHLWVPVVNVAQNVYIITGIPQLFRELTTNLLLGNIKPKAEKIESKFTIGVMKGETITENEKWTSFLEQARLDNIELKVEGQTVTLIGYNKASIFNLENLIMFDRRLNNKTT